MATPNTESSISNRDKFVLAKAWIEGLVIPGVKLKPKQACAQAGINLQTFWYHLRKEKGTVNDSDKSGAHSTSSPEGSDVTSIPIVHEEPSLSARKGA